MDPHWSYSDVLWHTSGILTEGAEKIITREDIKAFAEAGAYIQHLGDAGYGGMSLPENIQAYSIAVRSIRHTYRRMAGSVNR